jgi:photosystem II stability/assembly factor-like uncharacterized protein
MKVPFYYFILSLLLSFQNLSAQWVQTNGPLGGNISSITTDGTDIYIGGFVTYALSEGPGVYRSNNFGNNWTCVNYGLPNTVITNLIAHNSYIFAGTYGGVFRLPQAGASWTAVNNGLSNSPINCFAEKDSLLFIGTNAGCYVSSNNGNSWNSLNNDLNGSSNLGATYSILNTGSQIYAVFSTGIYILGGINYDEWFYIGMANQYANKLTYKDGYLYASAFGGVFRYNNSPNNWTIMNNGLTNLQIKSLASSTTHIYAGTLSGLYVSSDNGNSWSLSNNGLDSLYTIQSILCLDSSVYATTKNDGVYKSNDSGNSWFVINEGLNISSVVDILANGSTIFAATTGSGNIYTTNDNGSTWINSSNGIPGNATIVDCEAIDSTIYVSTSSGLYYSTNNGLSWSGYPNNILLSSPTYKLLKYGNTLYVGSTFGIVYTNDNGITWIGINAPTVNLMAINNTGIFAVTNQGLQFYGNGATSWVNLNFGAVSTNPIYMLVATDNLLMVNTSCDGSFVSYNNGLTWNSFSIPFLGYNYDLIQVLIDGNNIYAATNGAGVFLSNDLGNNWSNFGYVTSQIIFSLEKGPLGLYAGFKNKGVYFNTTVTALNENVKYEKEYSIKPNPTDGQIIISFKDYTEYQLSIKNSLGMLVLNSAGNSSSSTIDLSQLTSGIYYVEIKTENNKIFREKIILN